MQKTNEKLISKLCSCACLPSILLTVIGIWLFWKSSLINDDLKSLSLFFKGGGIIMILLGIIFMRNFIKIKTKEKPSKIKIESYILFFGGVILLFLGVGSNIIATDPRGNVDYFFVGFGSALIILGLVLLIITLTKIINKKE